eukprot:m.492605 g.492605  ORF g.492605 m.492605 type:complete len:366 (+) comp33280_c0_seq1:126-1223(+)
MSVVLLADVGGTNGRFRVCLATAELPTVASVVLVTQEFEGFPALVLQAVADLKSHADVATAGVSVDADSLQACCLAVCGPVMNGAATAIFSGHRKWTFSEKEIHTALGLRAECPVTLVNDFVAVGHGIARVPKELVVSLYEPPTASESDHQAPRCCLGPGTGLGQVYAVFDQEQQQHQVLPSEGCMSEFVAITQEQWDFRQWVMQTQDAHPYIDVLVSGTGLGLWYQWLSQTQPDQVDATVDAEIKAAKQPGGIIAAHGTPGTAEADPLCVQAMDQFVATLGTEAGNMGLRYLARGGVYLAGGGIIAKCKDRFQDGKLREAFLGRGLAQAIVANCPLRMVLHGDLGMLGVEEITLRFLSKQQQKP